MRMNVTHGDRLVHDVRLPISEIDAAIIRDLISLSRYIIFLGATKHLYNWLCPLVGRLVCLSVTHSFDDPHRRTYWLNWPCLYSKYFFILRSTETNERTVRDWNSTDRVPWRDSIEKCHNFRSRYTKIANAAQSVLRDAIGVGFSFSWMLFMDEILAVCFTNSPKYAKVDYMVQC